MALCRNVLQEDNILSELVRMVCEVESGYIWNMDILN
jgi:hypothetical protein